LSDLLAAVCDRFWRGLLLIDASRRILFANRTARRMLVERDGLQDMQGVLVLRDPKLHARFEARLQEAQASSAGEARSRFVFRLDREGARPAASLLVSRLEPAGVPAIAAFVVAVFDPRSNRRIETALLGELYGLTSAEADVAELLYAGRRFSEVAAELGVSPNTVKTHLSHVFRKCEVSTQAELLQLLALGPRG
jgi:DNA-binding CsgD family transcriptional regulator